MKTENFQVLVSPMFSIFCSFVFGNLTVLSATLFVLASLKGPGAKSVKDTERKVRL